ncbi:TraB/GumN family protein [Portibacter lacus]|uniref:Lipoprotein n=1 Tax=Portibacter lacus TaxID=1099794 RepID=A0AA37WC47_9BACT|nr:TraB/GumN family protein [Portibacter lacus]GLR16091.1 lipoprotein [Portibacter lacus]
MKNIFKIIFLFAVLIGVTKLSAQDEKIENSTLWKIEGNGLTEASYLLGTIHVMCESDFVMKDKVVNALKETSNLVLEIDFSDPEEIQALQKTLMGDQPLSEIYSEDQIEKLDQLLKKTMNAGIESFDQFSIMAVYSMILQKSISCPSVKMWEFELIALANTHEKEIKGLEKIERQAEFFNNAFPPDEMLEQLLIMDEYSDVFDLMVSTYNSEKITELGTVISDPRFMNKNAEYWMLEYRNKNWLEKMPEMMKEESNLFAVGSAHLIGEFGLIPNLRALGYNVTPVFN